MKALLKLFAWFMVVFITVFVPVVMVKSAGWKFGLVAFFVWAGVSWVLWVRQGLSKELFGTQEHESVLNDVVRSSARLAQMLAPYHTLPSYLASPIFVGLTEGGPSRVGRVPVRLPPELIRKNHISLLGASGAGKTKLATLILSQMLAEGDAVVVIDPKNDQFQPGTLLAQAKQLGRPLIYLNLRNQSPQLNPFANTTPTQREQLLQCALQLDPSGNPSVDFHRGEDRDACTCLINTGAGNIVDMVSIGATLKSVTSRTNFWRELRDLSRLGAFHTADCPDFVGAIQAGGLIYVVGDTDDLRIMAAQRMILARILQIIKGRERDGARQVSLFLDEYKYTISNVSLRALGTIRDRSCNLVLGYQNYADLEDCGNLPAKAVIGAAKGNTTLKFVFKLEDATTAKEFSLMAGEQSIMIETTGKILDDSGAEQGHWREASKAAVSVDMLTTNMPKPLSGQSSVSWVFGLGPAFLLSTMHLPAGPTPVVAPAKPLPTVASGTTAAQDLI